MSNYIDLGRDFFTVDGLSEKDAKMAIRRMGNSLLAAQILGVPISTEQLNRLRDIAGRLRVSLSANLKTEAHSRTR